MNKLIFLGHFDKKDLEEINQLLRERYFSHVGQKDYMAELFDDGLRVELNSVGINLFATIIPEGIKFESDDFFTMYDVAKIMADNFEEDFELRKLYF